MSKEFFSKPIDMSFLKKNVDREDNYEHYKNVCSEINNYEKFKASCPVCGEKNKIRDIFIEVYGIEYISCKECSHVYQDLILSQEDQYKSSIKVSKRMSKQLYEDKEKSNYRLKQVVAPKINFVLNHFPKNYSGKWLDVGCGTGELIKEVREYGWESSGIDNNESSISFAKKNYDLDIHFGNVEETDKSFFKNYDIISIFLLFEHLINPRSFFKNIAAGCKPGGMVVTEVNNSNSLSSYIQKKFPNKVDRHLLPCSHTNMFNHKSINYFFNLFGFELFSEWWFGQDFYELINIINESNQFNPGMQKLIESSNELQETLDKQKFSDRVIYIFKKK